MYTEGKQHDVMNLVLLPPGDEFRPAEVMLPDEAYVPEIKDKVLTQVSKNECWEHDKDLLDSLWIQLVQKIKMKGSKTQIATPNHRRAEIRPLTGSLRLMASNHNHLHL
jgi:hypothetical protein